MALVISKVTCAGLKPKAVAALAFTHAGSTSHTTCATAHREGSTSFLYDDQCLAIQDVDPSDPAARLSVAVDDYATPNGVKRLATFSLPLAKAAEQAVAASVPGGDGYVLVHVSLPPDGGSGGGGGVADSICEYRAPSPLRAGEAPKVLESAYQILELELRWQRRASYFAAPGGTGTVPAPGPTAFGAAENSVSRLEPPNVLMVRWLTTRGEVFGRGPTPFGGLDDGFGSDSTGDEGEGEGEAGEGGGARPPPPQTLFLSLGKAESSIRLQGQGDADGDGMADGPEEATLSVQDYWYVSGWCWPYPVQAPWHAWV